MSGLPTIELLESRHDFPGIYMFKVIGKAEDGFVGRVVSAVREVLAIKEDPPFTLRQTSKGRHVSITLTPDIDTPQQVLDVYQNLQGTPGLVLLM